MQFTRVFTGICWVLQGITAITAVKAWVNDMWQLDCNQHLKPFKIIFCTKLLFDPQPPKVLND